MDACNLHAGGKGRGSEVQSHLFMHSEFKESLGYMGLLKTGTYINILGSV